MSFLIQGSGKGDKIVIYFFTFIIILFSLFIGQLFSEIISFKLLGHSLLYKSEFDDLNLILALLLLPFIFVFFSIILSIKYLHNRPILSLFTSRKFFDYKRFFFSFFIWGALMVCFMLLSIITGAEIKSNFDLKTFLPLFIISLIMIPIQTTTEELFFRSFLFQAFGLLFKKGWIAILLTGILFGLMHGANPEVDKLGKILLFYYIGTGFFMSIISHMDDGIELSMGYHAINNIFASLILTNDWQAFQTNALYIDYSEPAIGIDSFLTIFLLQPLIILLFSKVYKWKNWKEKLFN